MIDCHLHLQDSRLGDLARILATVRSERIACLVVNGTEPGDWEKVASLSRLYPEVIPSFGVHPWRVNEVERNWRDLLGERLTDFPMAGVGEIGLDRWIKGHNLKRQKEFFQAQLALAADLRRPISIHCLNAWGSLLECLRKADLSAGCLLHSYGGSAELVGELVDLGAYFSLSGYFFRDDKTAKLKAFEKVPDERLLLETDAPDMLPPIFMQRHPLVGDGGVILNHPANLPSLYEAYASWRGSGVDEVLHRMRTNFAAWFFAGARGFYRSGFPILNG